MFPDWSWILGFVIGAAVGSFLNMVIYRMPNRLSFVEPSRSFCPKCKHPLGGADLIPLLSWLSTRGRCRYCKDPIASRYFWVEVLTGVLFALIWWQTVILDEQWIRCALYMAMCALLVAVIYIDWEYYIIPDELNAAIFVVGVAYHAVAGTLTIALWGALLGWGLLFGIALLGRVMFGKDAMGDGDIKMMRGVGALLGAELLIVNLFLAVILGILGGIAGIIVASRQAKGQAPDAGADPKGEGAPPTPAPVSWVLFAGTYYLLLLDILALFVKPIDAWAAKRVPKELVDEEDNWKPTPTTIPFGPYLAAGALACMIFTKPVEGAVQQYKDSFLSPATAPVAEIGLRSLE
jgi:leader peptidase (prepilin peptidase)/N-methyltransferase